ncbi:MAG TPA: hypothetical protein VLA72_16225 [Anaerolineales bacterium]|nr:hypothetical protein [Anaerolineales bacterium]
MDYQETQTDEKQVASEKKEEPKMTSSNKNIQEEKKKFRLYEHPWLSLLAMILTSIFSILLSGTVIFGILNQPDDSPSVQFTQAMSFHILAGFILAPFVLHLPKGKKNTDSFWMTLDLPESSRSSGLFCWRSLATLSWHCHKLPHH